MTEPNRLTAAEKAIFLRTFQEALTRKGWTSKELAKAADVGSNAAWEWCRGSACPYRKSIPRLEKALGLHEGALLGKRAPVKRKPTVRKDRPVVKEMGAPTAIARGDTGFWWIDRMIKAREGAAST